ncbi:hypothetical protein L1887_32587 [Cichorium endivia]|nr:hypothetical protein L1887_32587 [Cichorium endivia]
MHLSSTTTDAPVWQEDLYVDEYASSPRYHYKSSTIFFLIHFTPPFDISLSHSSISQKGLYIKVWENTPEEMEVRDQKKGLEKLSRKEVEIGTTE